MEKLWEYDEFSEPWLENGRRGNPPLIIVNRKRKVHKKGKKRMAKRRMPAGLRRYWAKHRRKSSSRKRSPARRRRRSRRNPWPMAGTVAAVNRKRSRRRGRKHSSRRRRGGYRRNPALLGISLPPLQSVIYAGVGFVGVPVVEGFLSRMLPVSLTGSTIGKYATRIGALLGLSFLTKMILGSSESKMVAIGGGAYVLTTAVSEFAPGLIPAAGMRAYRPATLGAYAASTRRQLGAPDFGAQNTVRSAGAGGANIVAQRFRRFQ
jgi:hypothetical protein